MLTEDGSTRATGFQPRKFVFTFIHIVIVVGVSSLLLISNNESVLFGLLLYTILLKWLYFLFGRCILTDYEIDPTYPCAADVTGYLISDHPMATAAVEKIVINMGLIAVITKLFLLLVVRWHCTSAPSTIRKVISTYLYSNAC